MRDYWIDFLRFVGISCVILAHVHVPEPLFELRCFDVPLMVFVSGISLHFSRGGCLRRAMRLCIPVYSFLSFLFFLTFCASWIGFHFYTKEQIAGSYLLLNVPSIGYVWVVRVFLMMGFLSPLVKKWGGENCSAIIFYISVALLLLLQIGLCSWYPSSCAVRFLYSEYLLYVTGYVLLYVLGVRLYHASENERKIVASFAIIILGLILWMKSCCGLRLNDYKSPPGSYFILYGLGVSVILFSLKSFVEDFVKKLGGIVPLISHGSMWIYLWHIPVVFLVNKTIAPEGLWWLRWGAVYVVAVGIYVVQSKIAAKMQDVYPKVGLLKYFQ